MHSPSYVVLNKFTKLNYRTKLMLCYFFIVSIPLILSIIYLYNTMVTPAKQNFIHTIDQRMDQELININLKIKDIKRSAYLFSTNTSVNKFFTPNYYADIQLVEAMNNEVLPLLSWFEATNEEIGSFRFFTNNTSIPESQFFMHMEPYKNEDWMLQLENNIFADGYYFEPLHAARAYAYSKIKSRPDVYSLFYPMLGTNSNTQTYLEININPNNLFNRMNGSNVAKSGSIIAVDHQGNIITSQVNPAINKALQESANFKNFLKNPINNDVITINDSRYYMSSRKIDYINSSIVCIVPESEISEEFIKAQFFFFGIVLGTTLLLLILSYNVASFLLIRINRMLMAVRTIQEGNFDIHIPVYGSDEIDQLADDINIMSIKINDLINKVYKADVHQKETELLALQSQINPHFLFNTLETFKMMAEINDLDELSDSITSLGNLMRYNISVGNHLVDLKNELNIVKDYIKIQNLLLNNRIILHLEVDASTINCKIPNLILQPLVENSIIHGFKDKMGELIIKISARQYDEDVLIRIEDNGHGTENQMAHTIQEMLLNAYDNVSSFTQQNSIGLKNVNHRLVLNFGNTSTLKVSTSSYGGFRVEIRIPHSY